jgi:hypothetical protein
MSGERKYHAINKLGLSGADVKAIESGNAARLIPRLQSV